MDLVAHKHHVVLFRQRDQLLEFVAAPHPPHRVMGTAENEHFCAGTELRLQIGEIDLVMIPGVDQRVDGKVRAAIGNNAVKRLVDRSLDDDRLPGGDAGADRPVNGVDDSGRGQHPSGFRTVAITS